MQALSYYHNPTYHFPPPPALRSPTSVAPCSPPPQPRTRLLGLLGLGLKLGLLLGVAELVVLLVGSEEGVEPAE